MIFYGYKDARALKFVTFKKWLEALGISSGDILKIEGLYVGAAGTIYNHFIVAPLGCLFAWWSIKQIYKIKAIRKVTSMLGLYSMQIYLLGGYFQHHYTGDMYVDAMLSFVMGVFIPPAIGKLVAKNTLMSKIFVR